MERRRIEAAEAREDEGDLAHYTTPGKSRRGRLLMQKMAWQEVMALGRGGGGCVLERQLVLWAARSHGVGRNAHAGIGVLKMASHACDHQQV
eukprot:9054665-Pyramimonas_sp.AAC.1